MRLRLLIAEAWRSLAANISTTFAATMTVLVGMFILGLFIALGTWTVSWSNHVKHELVVKVDFKTSGQKGGPATRAQENAVARSLQSNAQIKKFTFVPKLRTPARTSTAGRVVARAAGSRRGAGWPDRTVAADREATSAAMSASKRTFTSG